MMRRAAVLLISALLSLSLVLGSARSQAHGVDAATLSLSEMPGGRFLVRLRTNSAALQEEPLHWAKFPRACYFDSQYLDCGRDGLAGTVRFPWLEGSSSRLMVDITWLDGRRVLRIVTPSVASLTVYESRSHVGMRSIGPIAVDYTRLGVEHIWSGLDHLLFVVALTLLVRSRRSLLMTISAFTLAHSLSLAASVLDVVSLPAPPVEASIALSVVFVCAECLRPRRSLSRWAPELVAFCFGLLHGLGFASALQAVGLPREHVPIALLFFNVGVELGQLALIATVISLAALAKRFRPRRLWPRLVLIYGMGTVAAYWSLDRLTAVFAR